MVLGSQPTPDRHYPAGMEVIIGARNEQAMKIVAEQLAKGRRTIGVFYGAGHMPDLERRLLERGFQRRSIDWLTAWTVEPDGTPTTRAAQR